MTIQIRDRFTSDHPSVPAEKLSLCKIALADNPAEARWGEPYAFANSPAPPRNVPRCSALWRGYLAHFHLRRDGSLELVSYTYPLWNLEDLEAGRGPKCDAQQVGETLTGDFWLVLDPGESGTTTCVPFRAGRIVEDEGEWVKEQPREADGRDGGDLGDEALS